MKILASRPSGERPRHAAAWLISALLTGATLRAQAPAVTLADALSRTLSDQPGIAISRQALLVSEGQLQSAGGIFDWVLGSSWESAVNRTPTGAPFPFLRFQKTDTFTYTLGVQKEFRSGVVITPSAGVVDYRDNFSQLKPISSSNLAVQISVPLLRGLGEKHAAAEEIAARYGKAAEEKLTRYQIEQQISNTAVAYWTCLGAEKNLQIVADTESRAKQVYDLVDHLFKGGELDNGTMEEAAAAYASRRADRQAAELSLYEACQALGLAMGYSAGQLADAPNVAGDFPQVMAVEALPYSEGSRFVTEALARRGDYLAAGLNTDAQLALLEQARDNLKPLLTAQAKFGYNGLDSRASALRPYYALGDNLVGANAQLGLSLQWPIENNVARGAYKSQKATTEEARLTAVQAANGVASQVLISVETLRRTIAEFEQASVSVEAYKRAVAQARERLKIGEEVLTNVIDMEDNYATARESQNALLAQYATDLTILRLQTGTLIVEQDHHVVLNVATLTTLPFTASTQ